MFQTVLLPVDLNHETSWTKALPAALEMAKGGTLHLLAIVPDFGMSVVAGYFPPDFEKTALTHAEEALEAFHKAHVPAGTACQVHVGHGHVPEQILAVAGRLDADLIVMASHAPDRLRDLLITSNADRVVERAPVSVLVVR